MKKAGKILKIVFILLILAFIYAPIVLLTIYSFNASNSIKTWTGFSFRHYQYFFNFSNDPLPTVLSTLLLALIVATLSTVLGTAGAIGIFKEKKVGAIIRREPYSRNQRGRGDGDFLRAFNRGAENR